MLSDAHISNLGDLWFDLYTKRQSDSIRAKLFCWNIYRLMKHARM